jgi:hypothetical protein
MPAGPEARRVSSPTWPGRVIALGSVHCIPQGNSAIPCHSKPCHSPLRLLSLGPSLACRRRGPRLSSAWPCPVHRNGFHLVVWKLFSLVLALGACSLHWVLVLALGACAWFLRLMLALGVRSWCSLLVLPLCACPFHWVLVLALDACAWCLLLVLGTCAWCLLLVLALGACALCLLLVLALGSCAWCLLFVFALGALSLCSLFVLSLFIGSWCLLLMLALGACSWCSSCARCLSCPRCVCLVPGLGACPTSCFVCLVACRAPAAFHCQLACCLRVPPSWRCPVAVMLLSYVDACRLPARRLGAGRLPPVVLPTFAREPLAALSSCRRSPSPRIPAPRRYS